MLFRRLGQQHQVGLIIIALPVLGLVLVLAVVAIVRIRLRRSFFRDTIRGAIRRRFPWFNIDSPLDFAKETSSTRIRICSRRQRPTPCIPFLHFRLLLCSAEELPTAGVLSPAFGFAFAVASNNNNNSSNNNNVFDVPRLHLPPLRVPILLHAFPAKTHPRQTHPALPQTTTNRNTASEISLD